MAQLTSSNIFGDLAVTKGINGDTVSIKKTLSVFGDSYFSQKAETQDGFTSGFGRAGTLIDFENDYIETTNLTVRGRMSVYELLINQIRATNGSLWVTSSVKVEKVLSYNSSTGVYTLSAGEDTYVTFQDGDLVRAQRFTGTDVYQCNGVVTAVDNSGTLKTFSMTVSSGGAPDDGMEFVRVGSSDAGRQGSIYMTSDEINSSPYIDIIDDVDSFTAFQTDNTIKVRLGDLTGAPDLSDGTAPSGFGLYGKNVFLDGTIVAGAGEIGGWTLTGDRLHNKVSYGNGSNGMHISLKKGTSGTNSSIYSGGIKLDGLSMTWHKPSNAGHLVFGQIASGGTSIKSGYYGIQMMDHTGVEHFALSADTTVGDGTRPVYNRIAGWGFSSTQLYKTNKIYMDSSGDDGSLWLGGNTYSTAKIGLKGDGSGFLADGNIVWYTNGNAEFTGKITAGSGSIGGWNINATDLTSPTPSSGGEDEGIIRLLADDSSVSVKIGSKAIVDTSVTSSYTWEQATSSLLVIRNSQYVTAEASNNIDFTTGGTSGSYDLQRQAILTFDYTLKRNDGAGGYLGVKVNWYLEVQGTTEATPSASTTWVTIDRIDGGTGTESTLTGKANSRFTATGYKNVRLRSWLKETATVDHGGVNLDMSGIEVVQYTPKITINRKGIFSTVAPNQVVGFGDTAGLSQVDLPPPVVASVFGSTGDITTADIPLGANMSLDVNGNLVSSYVNTNTQRSDEDIRDVIGTALVQGGATTITVNDSANTITISSTNTNTQRSDEEIRDVIGTIISGSGATSVTYNDSANTIVVSSTDTNTWRGIDDTPVNGVTSQSISSNWAYDHANASNPHGTSKSDVGLGNVTNEAQMPLTGGTFTNDVSLTAGKWLSFVDQTTNYPSAQGGFKWTLGSDGASIYAYQPAGDNIDFVFKLNDNTTSTDRYVFWIDDYRGSGYDKYPLIMSGVGAAFGVGVDVTGAIAATGAVTGSNLNQSVTTGASPSFVGVNIGNNVNLAESGDRADLLQITSTTSNWGGLQIRNSSNEGRWSFMTNGNIGGIYDDENSDWFIYMTENSSVGLRFNGFTKLETTSAGVDITGVLDVSSSSTLLGSVTVGTAAANASLDVNGNVDGKTFTMGQGEVAYLQAERTTYDFDGFRIRTKNAAGSYLNRIEITTGMSKADSSHSKMRFMNMNEYYFDAYVEASDFILFSDRRLKSEIEDLYSIEMVRQLQPKSFIKAGTFGYGFIAQDIQKLMPSLVNDVNKYLSLRQDDIIALNTSAIQHIDSEVEVLKKEVADLKEKVKNLGGEI